MTAHNIGWNTGATPEKAKEIVDRYASRQRERQGKTMTEVNLEFIAKQIERILTEQGSQRDEMRVLSAIIMRVDNTTQRHESTTLSLMEELRAIHAQISRMHDRIRKLEDAR